MEANQIEQILEKYFKENMHNKDVEDFKRAFSTLYNKVIIPAMDEVYEKSKPKDKCFKLKTVSEILK